MDDLLEQFSKLVSDVAQEMQNDDYFSGFRELGEFKYFSEMVCEDSWL